MSKTQKDVDSNQLSKFLESEKYEVLKYNLNQELNLNSVHVNTKKQRLSNLLTSSIPTFTKTVQEKLLLKEKKKEYKQYKGTLHANNQKNDLLKTFVKFASVHYGLCVSKFTLI